MTILLPLIYLFSGWLAGRTAWDAKKSASWLLTKIVIPIVIVFNISTRFSSMGSIIIATALSMLVMLAVGRLVLRDPVTNLCFSYLNIGWLGLPVANALFGNDAAVIVIAAYVGSSIVGNSVGAAMLAGQSLNLKKIVQTPPVISLVIGAALIPFSQQISHGFGALYDVAKFLMSFLGMAILGMWLAKTKLNLSDFRPELRVFAFRTLAFFIFCSVLLIIAYACHYQLITHNSATLYLFCLLPPAANIIVLETHYLGSGRSARTISYGTCISIIAITLYAMAITASRLLTS